MRTLLFKSQSLFFFNPNSYQNAVVSLPRPPLSHRTQIQKPVVTARKRKRANGSLKLQRFLLRLVPIIASNLKLLPQPLDMVIEEISGGDGGSGGGGGFWKKGFGGGGFDGFGRRKKQKKKMLVMFLLYGILVSCGFGLLFGERDLESNMLLWCGLCFGAIGVGLVHWWEKRFVFGFFVCGVLVGLGFKNKEFQHLGLKLRPMMEHMTLITTRRTRRNGRRAF